MGGLGSRVAAGGCRLSSSAVTVAEAPSVAKRTVKPNAPVAQWIEQRFPKPRALVQFRPGALTIHLQEADQFAGILSCFVSHESPTGLGDTRDRLLGRGTVARLSRGTSGGARNVVR